MRLVIVGVDVKDRVEGRMETPRRDREQIDRFDDILSMVREISADMQKVDEVGALGPLILQDMTACLRTWIFKTKA